MKHLLTLTFLSFFGLIHAQVPSYVPTNGLVGWWPFNGNANDESGNGNNGTVNGATLSADRNGDSNKAYSFNNGIVTVSNNFYNNGWLDYTLSVWVKSIDVSQAAQNIYNTYPHDGEGLGLNHPNAPGKYSFWKNSNINVHAWDIFSANPLNYNTIQNNQWCSLVIRKEGLTYTFFVNGVLDKISIATIAPLSQSCGLNFGSAAGGEFFNGSLDDICIWNRALTDCEIKDLYNSQLGSANSSSSTTQTAIDSYTWPVNNQTYTQSGVYTDTLVNAAGCDSIITLNLELDFTGIQTSTLPSLKLYPNPVQDVLHIDGLVGKEFEYEVLSIDGKLLQKGKSQGEISVKELRKGNYVLRVGQQQVSFVKQ